MKRLIFRTLFLKLLAAYLIPTLALFAVFGLLVYRNTAVSLEQSLGQRLTNIAEAITASIRPDTIEFLRPGDDNTRTAHRLRATLRTIQAKTNVAEIVVFDRERHVVGSTEDERRIGDRYYQAAADATELSAVFAGASASSVLFRGVDGRMYKTGYAAITDGDRVIAVVGARGSAAFFDTLARLRQYIFASGAAISALLVLLTVGVARRITRPLRQLAAAATRIGAGDLKQPIAAQSSDETGLLATTMNEMREGLLARDQQMQLMLAGIAHEVRNPLAGISLFAGLLRESLEGDEEKLSHVQRVQRELGYLENVVTEFLDYARHRTLERSPVNITQLVGEVVEVLTAEAQQGKVSVACSADQTLATADREQLRRALINLLRNAIQACEQGGVVTISCNTMPTSTVIKIVDTGHGIKVQDQKRIFEPFFTTREKGTGLGLALTRKIIEQHGGTISIDSTVGKGTTVRVTLTS